MSEVLASSPPEAVDALTVAAKKLSLDGDHFMDCTSLAPPDAPAVLPNANVLAKLPVLTLDAVIEVPTSLRSFFFVMRDFYASPASFGDDAGKLALSSRTFVNWLQNLVNASANKGTTVVKEPEVVSVVALVDFMVDATLRGNAGLTDPAFKDVLLSLRMIVVSLELQGPDGKRALDQSRERVQTALNTENARQIGDSKAFSRNKQAAQKKLHNDALFLLGAKMLTLYQSLAPTQADFNKRDSVIAAMRSAFADRAQIVQVISEVLEERNLIAMPLNDEQRAFLDTTDIQIKMFGSSANELNFRTSGDVDFFLSGVATAIKEVLDILSPEQMKCRGDPQTKDNKPSSKTDQDTVAAVIHDSEDDSKGGKEIKGKNSDQSAPSSLELNRPDSLAVAAAAKLLVSCPEFEIKVVVLTCRVPVIKGRHISTDLEFDIASGNIMSLFNTALLKTYADYDDRVRPLIYVVKFWAKRRKLCSAYHGTLSSYAWTLLVLFFLQQEGVVPNLQKKPRNHKKPDTVEYEGKQYDVTFNKQPRKPNGSKKDSHNDREVSLGSLLQNFFVFYGYMLDIKTEVVSIRCGRTVGRGHLMEPYVGARWRLAIEDPFELRHDLGSKLSSKDAMRTVLAELRRAAGLLANDPQNTSVQGLDSAETAPLENFAIMRQAESRYFPRRCLSCGSTEHRARICPLEKAINCDGNQRCHSCGLSGHVQRNCRSKRDGSGRNSNSGRGKHKNNTPGAASGEECWECEDSDHLARNCPLGGSKSSSRNNFKNHSDNSKNRGKLNGAIASTPSNLKVSSTSILTKKHKNKSKKRNANTTPTTTNSDNSKNHSKLNGAIASTPTNLKVSSTSILTNEHKNKSKKGNANTTPTPTTTNRRNNNTNCSTKSIGKQKKPRFLCRDFVAGDCIWGVGCRFSHALTDKNAPPGF